MRLLHAGTHHGLGGFVAPQCRAQRGRDPRGAGQQYLPLHRLREDHRGGPACGPFAGQRGGTMSEIAPVHSIGGYIPMIDGPEKVSGRAKYTADFIEPGTLAGRIYRSPYSHADILEVDVSEA